MKRRLIAVFVACMMLMTFAVVASAADVNATKTNQVCDGTHGTEWTQWTATDSIPVESGKYVLMNDIVLTANGGNLTDKNITICLNGHDVTQTCTEGTARFYKASGATVITICDCTAHVEPNGNYVAGTFSGSRESAFFTDGNGAAINWYDGIIKNCYRPSDGGAFVVQKASSLNIYDGLFTENKAGARGGLVYLASDATMNIYGGRFTKNEATTLGGIAVAFGTVNIKGENTIIEGNKAGTDGGAFYLTNKPATMTGGIIRNNTAGGNGGAIALFTDKADRNPTLDISGGSILNNTATGKGGNVYVESSTLNVLKTTITGGTAAQGANIYGAKGTIKIVNLEASTTATITADVTLDVSQLDSSVTKTQSQTEYTFTKAAPSQPSNPTNPSTGDSANLVVMGLGLALGLAGVACLLPKKQKI